MAYLGRVVGVGINEDYKVFAVYAVSGRSEMSKTRKAITDGRVVRIVPSGELTKEQKKMGDLIFYDAIRADEEKRRAVISNGKQTDPILSNLSDAFNDPITSIEKGFEELGGAEPDKYRTPRIAGVIINGPMAALGIVTENDSRSSNIYLPSQSRCKYVSTYKGDPKDPKKIVIPETVVPTGDFDLYGKNAQKLANNMYDWMDPELVVCTAAVLSMDGKRWEFAVRNLHEW